MADDKNGNQDVPKQDEADREDTATPITEQSKPAPPIPAPAPRRAASFDDDDEDEAADEITKIGLADYAMALWPLLAIGTPLVTIAIGLRISSNADISLYSVLKGLDVMAVVQIAFLFTVAAIAFFSLPNICRALLGAPARHRSAITRNIAWFLFLPPALWTFDYFYLNNTIFQLVMLAEMVITLIVALYLYRSGAHKEANWRDLAFGMIKVVLAFVIYVSLYAHLFFQLAGDVVWLPALAIIIAYIVFTLVFAFGRVEDLPLMQRSGMFVLSVVLVFLFGSSADWPISRNFFDGFVGKHNIAVSQEICTTLPPHILYRDNQFHCVIRKDYVRFTNQHQVWVQASGDNLILIPGQHILSGSSARWAETPSQSPVIPEQ